MTPGITDAAGGAPAPTPIPAAQLTPAGVGRRRLKFAAAGTAVAVLGGAALMQVWRGEEGVAAEAAPAPVGQATVGKATIGDGPAAVPGRPQYLARVGNSVITYDQVADEAMLKHGEEVLDGIVNRTIIELACRERGVVVTEADVEGEITTIAGEFGLDRTNWLQMLQAERGLTPLQYKRDVIWPMLALKKLAGTDVQVTQADMQRAYERDYGPRVKGRMIMMDNLRRMQEVWQKANDEKTPEAFGRLAREHSIEPTSKSLDGAIPPIRRHTGQDNLERAAFDLKPGEVSGIVQLPIPGATRYVVIFCEGRTEPVVSPDKIDLVRDEIVKQIKKEKVQESVAGVFTKMKEQTPVHNFLTNTSTGAIKPAGGTAAAPGPARN